MNIKDKLRKYYVNLRGWRTSKKFVVIESDDWGSVRMLSQGAIAKLMENGVPVQENKFTLFDGLEKQGDIENLFEILHKNKNRDGVSAVMTPLTLVANPSFERIKENNFSTYKWECLEQTYSKYSERSLLQLWINQGIRDNIFYPQFHGREHINPHRWMKALQNPSSLARKAFEEESILGLRTEKKIPTNNYMAAFEAVTEEEQTAVNKAIKDGLDLFESTFGFKSISAMPSQSIISNAGKLALKKYGVDCLQCGQHFMPNFNGVTKVDFWWGHFDSNGLRYWRRNCTFEPYKNMNHDHVDQCLKEISIAFRCGKPAVISSHRINYTSRISSEISDRALFDLSRLLGTIVKKWPDVRFINSSQLANIMKEPKAN
mgnify:CR=1 FL=1